MTVEAHKETLEFKAEVSQILDLVIRSLYSNKEIFLRELVSNASDAGEKLRFEALTDDGLLAEDPDLRIRIEVDKEAGTLTVSDNGIGMSRLEVMDTIGSIASSGTRRFLEAMTGDQTKDSALIGQFGVGFYSAYIVADKVSLITRRAGLEPEHGVRWSSDGRGQYDIETLEVAERGTRCHPAPEGRREGIPRILAAAHHHLQVFRPHRPAGGDEEGVLRRRGGG